MKDNIISSVLLLLISRKTLLLFDFNEKRFQKIKLSAKNEVYSQSLVWLHVYIDIIRYQKVNC